MVEIGTRRMGFRMEPVDAEGLWLHGGNHYANADTIEQARNSARNIIGRRIDYCLCRSVVVAVEIIGEEQEFMGAAWCRVTGGKYSREVVR